MSEHNPTRREFLAGTAAAAAGAALSGNALAAKADKSAASQPAAKILNHNPKMGYRPLGRTGIMISEIGLGGHGTPGFSPKPTPATIDNRRRVLAKAAELGMNYLDTNIVEECDLYGQAIKGMRDKFHIGFASWPEKLTEDYESNLSVAGMTAEIDKRLKAYSTDYLDLWRPVGAALATDRTTMVSTRALDIVVEVYEKARSAGKVRHLGVSVHNPKVLVRVLENYPQFEVVLMPYLFLSSEFEGDKLTQLAASKNVGVIAIKPFAAGTTFKLKPAVVNGKLDANAAVMLKKVLENKAISCTIPGVNQPEQLEANVKASYERHAALTPAEHEWLAHYEQNVRTHLTPDYAWLHDWMRA